MDSSSNEPGSNRPVWDAEVTHPEICELLRQGLKEITDPEIGMDILQLGLVRNVSVNGDEITLKMILTTPFCPYGPAMIENTRQKAEEVLKKTVVLEMGLEPWDFSMMEEGSGGFWGMYP